MKKRDLKKKRKKIYLNRLDTIKKWWDNFPQIKIIFWDKTHPPSTDFVQAVHHAINQFPRIDQQKYFPDPWMTFYQGVKDEGIETLFKIVDDLEETADTEEAFRTKRACIMHLGQVIWDIMRDNNTLKQFLPYSDIYVRFMDKSIMVQLDQMLTAKTQYGTAYYSRYKPTVRLDEKDYVVAFSQHAIERIMERVVFESNTYGGYGDAFGVYGRCIYFEPCQIQYHGARQPAFTFYLPCTEQNISRRIRDMMLDYKIDPSKKYYFRVGYCPVHIENGIAKAITTLYPGMDGTPEHSLLMATQLPYLEKVRLIHSMDAVSSFKALCVTKDFNAMKWIHDNYIPQVVELPQDIYRYEGLLHKYLE